MKKSFVVLAILISSFPLLLSDNFRLSHWQSHSSLQNGTDCTLGRDNEIWFATDGGIFSFNLNNEKVKAYRNIDALMSLSVNVIAYYEKEDILFVGQKDGWLDLLTTKNEEWEHITDITRADFPNKSINSIKFKDGIAYIGGGFGLAVFDIEHKVFLENVLRIGDFQTETEVTDIILKENEIWLSTPLGVAMSKLSSPLTDPKSWTNYTNGLPTNGIRNITFDSDNKLYVSTEKTLFSLNEQAKFDTVITISDWEEILGLDNSDKGVLYSTERNVRDLSGKRYYAPSENFLNSFKNIETNNSEYMVLYETRNGFSMINESDTIYIKPNSPASNSFTDIDIAPDGSVWIASDYLGLR